MHAARPPLWSAGTDALNECVWASQGPKTTAAEGAIHHGAGVPSRRRGRENVKEFLAKKREIFLVQMGLDTKQLEINKLEERAMRR